MKDLALVFDSLLMEYDIQFSSNDVVMDESLRPVVIVSLFSDRRATASDILPDPNNKNLRGWWGDQTSLKPNDHIGSRIWLLERSKATQDALDAMKRFAYEALKWMIEEGIAKDIKVQVERKTDPNVGDRLYWRVDIMKRAGANEAMEFDNAWRAL